MSTLKVTHLQNESNAEPAITISSAGEIGIGTETPRDPVHIFHPTNNVNLLIESGDANSYLAFKDNATTSDAAVYLGAEGNNLKFITSAAERLRITSGGNVNIGGNYEETSHPLNISDSTKPSLCLHTGTTQRADFSATSGITSIRSFSNSPFTINIGGSGETEAFRITGDGNFGFGTNAPLQTSSGRTVLSINGTANSLLNFSHGGTLTGFIYGANDEFRFESNDTKPLIFRTAGGTALTIDTNAKLILPTGSPGIQFGSSDTGTNITSQTLDDYEEGSWTPIISGTSGGNYTAGSGNVGRYTRVGRIVTASATLHWTSASYSGLPYIGGLPFVTNSVSGYRVAGIIPGQHAGFYASGSYNSIKTSADWGQTFSYVVQANDTITSGGNYNHSPSLNSSGNIYGFAITYQTD